MKNPFSAPAVATSSPTSRGWRRLEEVGGGWEEVRRNPPPPTLREGEGGGGSNNTQLTLFATPTTPTTTTTKHPRRQPLNAWAHTTTTGRCPTCGQPTLQALENTDMPIRNTADPHTLTSAEELTALLAGRHTYTLNTQDHTLQRRTIHHIRGHPPEYDPQPVLPQHHCTNPLGTPLPPTPPTKEKHHDDHAPF